MTYSIAPIEWEEPSSTNNRCWVARTIIGNYSVCHEDGWYAVLEEGPTLWEWQPECDPRTYHGPAAAQLACQDHYHETLKTALQAA